MAGLPRLKHQRITGILPVHGSVRVSFGDTRDEAVDDVRISR